jgi:hypothetical protein
LLALVLGLFRGWLFSTLFNGVALTSSSLTPR